jgi:CheY-like chemotaxis protein
MPEGRSAPRARVLVVDDYRAVADALCRLLAFWGHDARAAYDGPDAVGLAAEYRPHAVLLDLDLPHLGGPEVARRLRLLPGVEGTVLLAITGLGADEGADLARAAGCDHHLLKPLLMDELRQLVDAIATAAA